MGLDMTTFDAALKNHYTDDRVENMVYQDNPLLALLPKMEDFGGRNLPIPLIYGNPQGRSTTFARAQARSLLTNTKLQDFYLTRVKDYGVAVIDNETLEASKGNANAFLEAATTEIDGIINALTRSLATALFKSGYGDIGVIGSISTSTITLATASDVVNFEVGMELDVAATQAGAARAYGSSGNGLLVTAIDRSAGTVSFGYNVTDATNGVPAAAAGDTLFVRGDHAASTLTKVSGLEAWCPASSPTSSLFFGVDRSVDATRLGGLRMDGSAMPIEEALIDGAAKVAREGQKLDHYFMSYENYSKLEKALGAKVQYVDLMANADVGFRGVQINGPRGPIKIVPDQNCPSNRVFGLALNMWKLYSLGKAIRVIDTDGLQMLRQASADGVECRYGFYGNLGTRAPGANINIQV
jgi:hypothetical protein